MIRVPSPDILEYADTYHLDTVVIMWKATDVDEAERSREYVASKPELLETVNCTLHYTADFGPMSGFIFFAFGENGLDEEDGIVLDDYASGIPSESEMYYGNANSIFQSGVIKLPNLSDVA